MTEPAEPPADPGSPPRRQDLGETTSLPIEELWVATEAPHPDRRRSLVDEPASDEAEFPDLPDLSDLDLDLDDEPGAGR